MAISHRALLSNDYAAMLVELLTLTWQILWTVTCSFFGNVFFFLPRRYKDISGDVVLITGGGRGIGRLIASEFANRNPKQIILWGRHEDTLLATSRAIQLKNIPCDYMICDVGCPDQVIAKAKEVRDRFGGADILVNNAAVVSGGTVASMDVGELRRTIDVNLMSHFWILKEFLPYITHRNHGHIVSINSILGHIAMGGAADYSASKFGALGLHEALAMELAHDERTGVHLTTVHPYLIDTEMFAGVRNRFSFLFPPLEPNYVAWKVVNAVCTNQSFCVIPRAFYLVYYLKCFLPYETLRIAQKFIGLDKAMDSWHGSYGKRNSDGSAAIKDKSS